MNTIEKSSKGIKVNVSVFIYLDTEHPDGDIFVAYCPSLNLVGYGHGEENAKKDFEWMMRDYLEEMTEQGTLEKDLRSLGWTVSKETFCEPMVSDMLNCNEQLKEVVNGSDYHKLNVMTSCPAFA